MASNKNCAVVHVMIENTRVIELFGFFLLRCKMYANPLCIGKIESFPRQIRVTLNLAKTHKFQDLSLDPPFLWVQFIPGNSWKKLPVKKWKRISIQSTVDWFCARLFVSTKMGKSCRRKNYFIVALKPSISRTILNMLRWTSN